MTPLTIIELVLFLGAPFAGPIAGIAMEALFLLLVLSELLFALALGAIVVGACIVCALIMLWFWVKELPGTNPYAWECPPIPPMSSIVSVKDFSIDE